MWLGVLHHVVDEHEWLLPCYGNIVACSHGPLPDEHELEWLSIGSAAHDTLRGIVADRSFLKKISYFLNAR